MLMLLVFIESFELFNSDDESLGLPEPAADIDETEGTSFSAESESEVSNQCNNT